MSYLGDFTSAATIDLKFTTVTVSGVPTTLSGTPVVSVYRANTTVEVTTGVTLTTDFDARTGLNHVRLVATDAYYSTASDFQLVITTGTSGGNSVVGYVVGEFSLENRPAARNLLNAIWNETQASHTTAGTFGLFLDTAVTSRPAVNAIWNETQASHTTAGTFGLFLDTAVSSRPTVNAIWNETKASHTTANTFGLFVDTSISGLTNAIWNELQASHTTAGTFGLFVDTTISSRASVNAIWNETQASHTTAGTFGLFLDSDVNTVTAVGSGAITNTSFAAAAIDAAAIAANALGASELAQDAAQEIADEVLNRDIAGSASGGARNVRSALQLLRNKRGIAGTTLTVMAADDVTTAWTAVVSTASGSPIVDIDPG